LSRNASGVVTLAFSAADQDRRLMHREVVAGDKRDDGWHAVRRQPEHFYISRPFPHRDEDGREDSEVARFAWQVFDATEDILGTGGDGFEIALRETPTRQQLKALFIEDSRRLQRLWFQRFSADGKVINRESFTLAGEEIGRLILLLQLITDRRLPLDSTDEGFRLSMAMVLEVLRGHPGTDEALEAFLRTDADAPDVIALARRLKELTRFEELLTNEEAFESEKERLAREGGRRGDEAVWQDLFERHKWMVGTGAATQFLHSWDPSKLEQTVRGWSMLGPGVRPDAVLRSAGAISALALLEIKSHNTPLLAKSAYRSGVWGPSSELSGAVAQCQQAVQEVERAFERQIQRVDADSFTTGEWTAVCRPRTILVIGSLSEFQAEGGTSWVRFESFERYRRSLTAPEIITFDELCDRARLSLRDDSPIDSRTHAPSLPTTAGISPADVDPYDEAPF